ncbi:unnamed protein product, partial [Prorocentrum cordatum]
VNDMLGSIIDREDYILQLRSDFDSYDLGDLAKMALVLAPIGENGSPRYQEMHIYTHGSRFESSCDNDGWAVVIVTASQRVYIAKGYAAGRTRTASRYTEAGALHSTASELVAMFWALAYTLKHETGKNGVNTITSDSADAIAAANRAAVYKPFEKLSRCVAILAHEVRHLHALEVRHTKSHDFDPWNQMADAIAKQNHRADHYTAINAVIHYLPELEWCSLKYDQSAGFYYDVKQQQLNVSDEGHVALYSHAPDESKPRPPAQIYVKIATYNAMTLAKSRCRRTKKGVAPSTEEKDLKKHAIRTTRNDFIDRRVSISGAREARGADAKDYADGDKDLYLTEEHPRVLHRAPTLLLIKIAAPAFTVVCAVAHAPHHHVNIAERQEWWHDFNAQAKKFNVDTIFIDANAQLGANSSAAPCIGPLGAASKSDANGKQLASAARELDMVAANSHYDGGPTYRDHDHSPVIAEARFASTAPTPKPARRSLCRAKYSDEHARTRYSEALKIDESTWDDDVNLHYQRITEGIAEASSKAFAKDPLIPTRSHASLQSMRLIRVRRHAKREWHLWKTAGGNFKNLMPHLRYEERLLYPEGTPGHQETLRLALAMSTLADGTIDVSEAAAEVNRHLMATTKCPRASLDDDKRRHYDRYASQLSESLQNRDRQNEWRWLKKILKSGGDQQGRFKGGNLIPYRLDENNNVIDDEQKLAAVQHAILADIGKGKGDTSRQEAYTSITLCNTIAKHHYKFLRSKLKDLATIIYLDSQADMVFNMAFTRPLTTINQRMLHEELTISVKECMPVPRGAESLNNPLGVSRLAGGVTYADDTAFAVLSNGLADTLARTKHMADMVHESFRTRAMELNLRENKTAALACVNGPKSKQTMPHLYEKPTKLTTDEWGLEIDVVRDYQHMGTTITTEGSWGPEVQRRVIAHKNALEPMLRTVFKDDIPPAKSGAKFADAMSNARLTYQAELWCGMAAADQKNLK